MLARTITRLRRIRGSFLLCVVEDPADVDGRDEVVKETLKGSLWEVPTEDSWEQWPPDRMRVNDGI